MNFPKTLLIISVLPLLVSCAAPKKSKRGESPQEKKIAKMPLTAAVMANLERQRAKKTPVSWIFDSQIQNRYGCSLNFRTSIIYDSVSPRNAKYIFFRNQPKESLGRVVERLKKEDPKGEQFYSFWTYRKWNSKLVEPDCTYKYTTTKAKLDNKSIKWKIREKQKVRSSTGHKIQHKFDRYRTIEAKLNKVKNNYARLQKKRTQAEVNRAWAKVDASVNNLQSQTKNIRTAAKSRLQQKKEYNTAAQIARKHRGYKVVQKGENASRESLGMSTHAAASSSSSSSLPAMNAADRELLSYASEAGLTENEIFIFSQGSSYYMDYYHTVSMVEREGKVSFDYKVEFQQTSPAQMVLSEGSVSDKNLKWAKEYDGRKSENEAYIFPDAYIADVSWSAIQAHLLSRRKERIEKYLKIYQSEVNLDLAREAALAVVFHGGQIPSKTASRFTELFGKRWPEVTIDSIESYVSFIKLRQ